MERNEDIPATYENGMFRPESPVDLPEHSRVRLSVHEERRINGARPRPPAR
jgi:predicted DNA-binding antitoxin AbrB/MazE fold protein